MPAGYLKRIFAIQDAPKVQPKPSAINTSGHGGCLRHRHFQKFKNCLHAYGVPQYKVPS